MEEWRPCKTSLTPKCRNNIQDITGLISFAKELETLWDAKALVYRGQGSHCWGLRTSLERAFERWRVPEEKRVDAERFLLKDFIRRAHHFLKRPPSYKTEVDILEWLSLLQHYGAPTRLLDWSYSIYYAVFMAIDSLQFNGGVSEDSAVWITDPRWCRDQSNLNLSKCTGKSITGDLLEHRKDAIAESGRQRIRNFREHFWEHRVLTAYPANGFRLNDRVSVQQGVFLCPGNVVVGFEHNFVGLESDSQKQRIAVCKLMTSDLSVRENLMLDLLRMGISRNQVYPGLEGFAKSLDLRLALWERLA